MYKSELTRIALSDPVLRHAYAGTLSADDIASLRIQQPLPFACVVNNEDRDEPGEHWVAFYIDRRKRGTFFDSYGMPPSYFCASFVNFLDANCHSWSYNKRALQSIASEVCGHYCLYVLMRLVRGCSLSSALSSFDVVNSRANDRRVYQFVRHAYRASLVHDRRSLLIHDRICRKYKLCSKP